MLNSSLGSATHSAVKDVGPPRWTRWLRNDPVTMAWRLTGDKHANRFHTAIQRLVLLAWGNLDSFTCLKNKVVILDLQGQFTFQNEEELACMDVGVSDLTCSSGHEFLDDAEVWRFNEVPTIAISSVLSTPLVVFSRFYAYYFCRHEIFSQTPTSLTTEFR